VGNARHACFVIEAHQNVAPAAFYGPCSPQSISMRVLSYRRARRSMAGREQSASSTTIRTFCRMVRHRCRRHSTKNPVHAETLRQSGATGADAFLALYKSARYCGDVCSRQPGVIGCTDTIFIRSRNAGGLCAHRGMRSVDGATAIPRRLVDFGASAFDLSA
jgi:hypothetical protein